MMHVKSTFPESIFIVRADDDIYLRVERFLWMLSHRAPFAYWWGNFDHGSTPVRDETHPHYNSHEQFPPELDPISGDLFPIYARGSLWTMSNDLFMSVADAGFDLLKMKSEALNTTWDDDELAESVVHPDDPLVGVLVRQLVRAGRNVNIDDRDFNVFSLNPSCTSRYSSIHNRTLVVHHATPSIVECMWSIDSDRTADDILTPNTPRDKVLASLCECGVDVEEEESDWYELQSGVPFTYPKERFNDEDCPT